MNYNTIILIILFIIILILLLKYKEAFYNPPSRTLYQNDQYKYKNYDPVTFPEETSKYYYGYDIPQISNFENKSALYKYRNGIKGVDINRRTWPGFTYDPYKN